MTPRYTVPDPDTRVLPEWLTSDPTLAPMALVVRGMTMYELRVLEAFAGLSAADWVAVRREIQHRERKWQHLAPPNRWERSLVRMTAELAAYAEEAERHTPWTASEYLAAKYDDPSEGPSHFDPMPNGGAF